MHFGDGASGNDVMVGDSFKSSCAVGQSAPLDGAVCGGVGGASGGVAITSFYDTTPASSSCDVTQSNGVTSSFGFTQEQVACVCEVREVASLFTLRILLHFSECYIVNAPLTVPGYGIGTVGNCLYNVEGGRACERCKIFSTYVMCHVIRSCVEK